MSRTRLAALTAAILLVLAGGTAPSAAAKAKPKPDRTPPHSVIDDRNNAVKIGMDADRDAPVQPPGPLAPRTVVTGRTTDNKGGLIDYVVIRFSHEDPVAGTLGEIETATCEPPRRTCRWSARVPWLDDDLIIADPVLGITHGIPARWTVTVKAYDEAGNVEPRGPSITILVI
ncbi:MAG: hypothetical protein LC722_07020 [Actinobacteria bacterium]|nr:hypothetical protein [Actinomycetota bacterium]